MQQYIFRVFLLVVLLNNLSFAQVDKDVLFSKVKGKFAGLKTLFVKYESLNGMKGNIKVKRVGKFVLNMGDNVIYCNGKTTWNLNYPNKRVTIDNVIKGNENSMVEEIFFNIIGSSTPTAITKSNGSNLYQIDLEISKEGNSKSQNITNLKLFSDEDGNIKKITFKHSGKYEELRIQNISLNPNFKDSVFDLTPPQGFQVIDLR